MALNDVYKVNVVFHSAVSTKDLSFGFHLRQDAAAMESMAVIGGIVKSWWNDDNAGAGSAYREFCPEEIQLDRVTLRRIKPLEPLEQLYTTGLPIVGLRSGDPLAPQTSVIVSLRTAKIGRSYRGRCYLPPTVEDREDTGGALSVAHADLIRDQFANMVADFSGTGNVEMCVYSPLLDTSDDVASVLVDRRFRTQRRRADRTPIYVA